MSFFLIFSVLTRPSYYTHSDIAFKGVQAHDEKRFPIYRHFEDSSRFMDEALKNGGKPRRKFLSNFD